ncbi:hypothetical protein, partial [Thiolapillus sp.]
MPIVARRYTIDSGTLRYFVPVFADASSYEKLEVKSKRPRIHTCFPHLTLCRLSPGISRHRRNRWTC